MKPAAPFLPARDAATQRALDTAHIHWRRTKFGAAAIGCALLLAACGGGDEPPPESEADTPPMKVPRPDCTVRPEECR